MDIGVKQVLSLKSLIWWCGFLLAFQVQAALITPAVPTVNRNAVSVGEKIAVTVYMPNDPDAIEVQLRTKVGGAVLTPEFIRIAPGTNKTVEINAESSGTYQFYTRTCNTTICSDYSATRSVQVSDQTLVTPKAPTISKPSFNTGENVPVTIYMPNDPFAIEVQLRTVFAGDVQAVEFYPMKPGTNKTVSLKFNKTGTYQFHVRTCNTVKCSDYITTASVQINEPPLITPKAPTVSKSTFDTGEKVPVTIYMPNDPFAMEVQLRTVFAGEVLSVEFHPMKPDTSKTVSLNFNNAGTYQFYVRTCNTVRCSTLSSLTSINVVVPKVPDAVVPPEISPNGGKFTSASDVRLSSATTGATIRYTTNGSNVTSSSTLYTAPIKLSNSATVKARAFKAGMTDSTQAIANFEIQAASPVITPNGGSHNGAVPVCLSTTTSGAEIRYSTDGSDVTKASKLYTECLPLENSATVKAKAFRTGMTDSAQSSAVFNITPLKGPITKYGYDARGRLIHIDDDKGISATYALDTAGNRMVVQDQTAPPLSPEITMLTPNPDTVTKPTEVTISWKAKNTSACSLRLNRGNGEPEVISGGGSGSIKAIISSQTGVILTCVYRDQSKSLANIIKGPRQ